MESTKSAVFLTGVQEGDNEQPSATNSSKVPGGALESDVDILSVTASSEVPSDARSGSRAASRGSNYGQGYAVDQLPPLSRPVSSGASLTKSRYPPEFESTVRHIPIPETMLEDPLTGLMRSVSTLDILVKKTNYHNIHVNR